MKVFYVLFILFIPIKIFASVSNGTIDLVNKNALVCHSVDCITPTPGIINFKPTGVTPVSIDDIDGINGVVWGNEIGWINLNPTGSEGLTINPDTGIISGKAWSQVSGWINFSVTGQTVKINNNGEFEGWAWTGGPYGGWIKFDCNTLNACVKTDWIPVSQRPVDSPNAPSGGSTVSYSDLCPNIVGYQDIIPSNYSVDQGGLCSLKIDYCKNIDDIQAIIPVGYVVNGLGQCVLLNEDNKTEFFPEKLTTESIEVYNDICLNLFGLQSNIPDGFVKNENDCLPKELDYCPNILGPQYEIPKNMKISNDGSCVKMTKDEIKEFDDSKIFVLAYNFVPSWLIIPIEIPFLNNLIDLFSIIITIFAIIFVIIFIKYKFKK